MEQIILDALHQIEQNKPELITINPVSGGDINQAFQAVTAERSYFIKLNSNVTSDFFKIEAEGIKKIRETKTVSVPEIFFFNEPNPQETGILVQEWIEGKKTNRTGYQLGSDLARLHAIKQKNFGYPGTTFVGTLLQENGCYDNWVTYYRKKRLIPQFELAAEYNLLSGNRGRKLERLIERLENWIPVDTTSSLLHGDLWGGNWLTGKDGKAFLIDPSIFYGDRLMEIAFTELFGGFPSSFYDGYQEVAPLPSHYSEVKALYQLFYLLVHLNLFGEGYGSHVDQVLEKYV